MVLPEPMAMNRLLMIVIGTGPNYILKLFNILIRFRWHKIAVAADVEKAFLMIGIAEDDRDFL